MIDDENDLEELGRNESFEDSLAERDEGDGYVCHGCGAVYPTTAGLYDADRDMWLCGPSCPGEPTCEPTP